MSEPSRPAIVNLVDERTGELVNVNESDLGQVGAGYRLATDDEVARDLERQEYGQGFGNELAAFGEGALSGATVGLSDVAAKYFAPEYAEGLAKRREYNPLSAGLGEAAGLVGSALLTGGGTAEAGVALRGARAATMPARGLLGAGELATATTARLLGTEAAQGVLGQAIRQGVAHGAGGLVEGALFGAAKNVTDDYLNGREPEGMAERVWTGILEGGGLGAAFGGPLGMTGSLLGAAGRGIGKLWNRTDADRVATGALEEAIDATPGMGASAEASAAEQTLRADQKILQQVGYKSDDTVLGELTINPTSAERASAMDRLRAMAQQEGDYRKFQDFAQDAATDIVADGEEFRRLQDEISTFTNRGHKRDAIKAQIEVAPPEWSLEKVQRVDDAIEATRTRLLKMREDATALDQTQHAALKEAIELAGEVQGKLRGFTGRRAGDVAGPASPESNAVRMDADAIADVYDIHDKFKSALGRASKRAGRSTPDHVNTAEAALRRDAMQHRSLLEAEDLYGKGATELQRITNAADSEAFLHTRAFENRFGLPEVQQEIRAGKAADGTTFDDIQTFDKVSELSHPKVKGLMREAGVDPQAERTFVLGLQRQADAAVAKSRFYSMPPEVQAKAARMEALAQKMIGKYREAKALRQSAEEYAQELSRVRDLPFYGEQLAKLKIGLGRSVNLASNLISEASATATGGAARAAVRAGIRGEEAMQRAGRGVTRWLAAAGRATGRAASTAGKAVTRTAKSGPLLGVSLSADQPATVERLIRNIGALRDPQSDERRAMRVSSFPLRQENPQLAAALEAHTQRVADFLAAKAGELSAVTRPGDPFGRLRQPRHSAAKAAKLARYVDAATNPAHALERIGNGDISREDVEVLQTLYPRMYQRMVNEVLMNLGSVDELPTYEARVKLSHLLNAPADPSMRPENAAALQQLARTGAQPSAQQQSDQVGQPVLSPSQRRAPTKLGRMYSTQTDRMAEQGALG